MANEAALVEPRVSYRYREESALKFLAPAILSANGAQAQHTSLSGIRRSIPRTFVPPCAASMTAKKMPQAVVRNSAGSGGETGTSTVPEASGVPAAPAGGAPPVSFRGSGGLTSGARLNVSVPSLVC